MCVGGQNRDGFLSTAEAYDATTGDCYEFPCMKEVRDGVRAVAWQGQVLVAGGTADGRKALNTVEMYSPVRNEWTGHSGMIEARCDHALVAVDGRVYAIGGVGRGFLNSVEVLGEEGWRSASALKKGGGCYAAAVVGVSE